MSESQLKARRTTRAKAVLERGEKLFDVEQVEVRRCSEGVAKVCGSFLYLAFVHSVLLHNCEVWNITETEMKALVGRNGYLMRRLVGEVVRSADDKRLTESQLLEMLGLDSIQS